VRARGEACGKADVVEPFAFGGDGGDAEVGASEVHANGEGLHGEWRELVSYIAQRLGGLHEPRFDGGSHTLHFGGVRFMRPVRVHDTRRRRADCERKTASEKRLAKRC
jgi:hypothetical protein